MPNENLLFLLFVIKSLRPENYREPICVTVVNVVQSLIQKTSRELVGTRELSPRIGFTVGNQACIVPRLLPGLLFATTPSPRIEAANVYCISLK